MSCSPMRTTRSWSARRCGATDGGSGCELSPPGPASRCRECEFARAVTQRAYDGQRSTAKFNLDERSGAVTNDTETAILAGGCFWGVQDLLRKRDGIISTRVGYTGGENANPTYGNHPGHAEAVEIVFDPERISYRDILEFFFQ